MKRYLLLVAVCLAAVSCDQETDFYVTPDIRTIVMEAEGGSFDDVIFTNGVWTTEISDEAVTITPSTGSYTTKVHVVVGENQEHFTKAIRIRFTSSDGDNSRTGDIVITQQCHPFLLCDEPVKTIGAAGGKVFFSVNSNAKWGLMQWDGGMPYEVTPQVGGPNRTDITVTVSENTSGEERTLPITIHLIDSHEVTLTLKVVQGA